jgi:hypothetical protein
MKLNLKKVIGIAFLVSAPFFVPAQTPPHPNGGSNPGAGNGPVGGGAAVESGLTILLAMGAAYGSRKYYQQRNSISIED